LGMGMGLGYGSCIWSSSFVIVLLRSVLRLQLRLLWLQWLLSRVIRGLGLGWWLARVPDALLPAGMVVSTIA